MSTTESLKIVVVGHVDHGKSTLIGRIFHDTGSLPEGKVEAIRKASEAEGMEFEFAFLLDALLEEQEQNITIDTTQIHFRTAKRDYIIIDAPGHKEFLKNMVTGAAQADAAVLLIDAHEGVQEQSRRHGYLLSLLGIRQVIVVVNKMDLVGNRREVFDAVEVEYREFLAQLNVMPAHFIPVSAKFGYNVAVHSPELSWFEGPTILDALDSFQPPRTQDDLPARLVVQDVYRFDARRIIAGRLEAGRLAVGDEIVFWPDRKHSRIKTIEAWGEKTPVAEVRSGESVAITLEEQIFVERGQIGALPSQPPAEGREFSARIFWLDKRPLPINELVELRLGTQVVGARVVRIHRVVDSSTLAVAPEDRHDIRRNETAEITLRARRPLAFDNGDRVMETGRFVLLLDKRIGGGGVIFGAEYPAVTRDAVMSSNISWTEGEITRESRIRHFGHRGAVIWLTGLSGAGKSTLAVRLEQGLFRRGVAAFVLDGDNLRHGLCANLGFSPPDRAENIRRAGEAARLMADAGMVVITALISPFREERQKVREICASGGVPFAEVYVNAPLATCEQRDPKSLYKRARSGEIKGFTGIDSPYEPPLKPELELHTDELTVEAALTRLLQLAVTLAGGHTHHVAGPDVGSGI